LVHEWDVVGRKNARDVADHDACNAFNRPFSLVVYPCNDRRARRQRVIRSVVAAKRAIVVYLMTGTLTGLLGNRILLTSRSKTRAVVT